MENTHIDLPVKMDDDDEPIIFKCFMRMASVYKWLDEEDFQQKSIKKYDDFKYLCIIIFHFPFLCYIFESSFEIDYRKNIMF